jgi:hypothetical protein
MENYGDGVSDRIVKPHRDKDGVLMKPNMQVRIWSHHCPYSVTFLELFHFSHFSMFQLTLKI